LESLFVYIANKVSAGEKVENKDILGYFIPFGMTGTILENNSPAKTEKAVKKVFESKELGEKETQSLYDSFKLVLRGKKIDIFEEIIYSYIIGEENPSNKEIFTFIHSIQENLKSFLKGYNTFLGADEKSDKAEFSIKGLSLINLIFMPKDISADQKGTYGYKMGDPLSISNLKTYFE